MNILIDTHIALWSLYDDSKLSSFARNFLLDINNNIWYSLASAWEIEIKNSLGKINVDSGSFIRDCDSIGFCLLPIRKEHIIALKDLPYPESGHKDPFDRLLITQANIESMHFLTQDSRILDYQQLCILRE